MGSGEFVNIHCIFKQTLMIPLRTALRTQTDICSAY